MHLKNNNKKEKHCECFKRDGSKEEMKEASCDEKRDFSQIREMSH